METQPMLYMDDHGLIISTSIILIICVLVYIFYRYRKPQTRNISTQIYIETKQKNIAVQTGTKLKSIAVQTGTKQKNIAVQTVRSCSSVRSQTDVKTEIETTSREVQTETATAVKSKSRRSSYRTPSDDSDEDNGDSCISRRSPGEPPITVVRSRYTSIGDGNIIQCTDSVNSTLKNNLLVSTKDHLEQHNQTETRVERSGLYAVIKCLTNHQIAIITGVSGEGKTNLALTAMSKMIHADDRRIPIILKDPLKWDEAISLQDEHLVVFIDDIFGESYFRQDIYEHIKKHFSDMLMCVRKKKIFLLIACKSHILEEALQSFTSIEQEMVNTLFSKEYTVDLSTKYKLTETEREAIIRSHIKAEGMQVCDNHKDETIKDAESLKSKEIAISQSTIFEICKIFSPPSVGFPQVCRLFVSRKIFLASGQSFFKKPDRHLINDIKNMQTKENDMYKILVVCLLQEQNLLNENDLTRIKTNTSSTTLQTKLKAMGGVYLVKSDDNTFTFSHKSIMESVLFVYCRDAPEDILKNCSDKLLSEYAECKEEDDSECVFPVRQQHYPVLFDRVSVLLQTKVIEPLILSSGRLFLSKEFTEFFFKQCKEGSFLNNFLHFRYSVPNVCSKDQKMSILFYSANSPHLLKRILENLSHDDLQSSYFQDQQRLALDEALRKRNTDAVKLLLKYKFNISKTSIGIAVLSDKTEIVEQILNACHWTSEQLIDALETACEANCVNAVKSLLDQTQADFSKCLPHVTSLNDIALVQKVMSKKQWTMEDLGAAIRVANKQNLLDMASYLHCHYKRNV